MKRSVLVAALAAACAGCATPPSVVVPATFDLRYARQGDTAARCAVVIGAFTDRRPDPAYVGMFYGRPVRAENLVGWLRGGIEARQAAPAGGSAVSLDAEVIKAYMTHQSTSISASLVIRVRMSRDGVAGEPKLYRGSSTGINWGGGTSEVLDELSIALGRVMDQVEADAGKLCAGAPGTARAD